MYNLINTYIHTHTHTQVSLIPPWEDQCEWHRMTRMTGPDCAVMCNLINTHTHTHTQIYIYMFKGEKWLSKPRIKSFILPSLGPGHKVFRYKS